MKLPGPKTPAVNIMRLKPLPSLSAAERLAQKVAPYFPDLEIVVYFGRLLLRYPARPNRYRYLDAAAVRELIPPKEEKAA